MKIIRYLDNTGQIGYGANYNPATGLVEPLAGDFRRGFRRGGRPVKIRKLLAPVAPPAIFCIGLNYRAHAAEFGADRPERPIVFMKNPASIAHPGDPILLPRSCLNPPQVDYEAELVVVLGQDARNVPAARAREYIFGYTAGNDVSARHWQKHAGGGQWVRGKSFDTFCPLGPQLVSADEIGDPQALAVQCLLNDNLMQDGTTTDMIFPVTQLIEYLSEDTTLLAGTVIMTGTPAGVGFTRTPPVFLKAGDQVEIRIDRIGSLRNRVALAPGPA